MASEPQYTGPDYPPHDKVSMMRRLGTSDMAAGVSRITMFAFPFVLTLFGWLISHDIEALLASQARQGSELQAAQLAITAGQVRGTNRDLRLDHLEILDSKIQSLLGDHDHRITVLEAAAIADQERRLRSLEFDRTLKPLGKR